jgi:hypothetical protein
MSTGVYMKALTEPIGVFHVLLRPNQTELPRRPMAVTPLIKQQQGIPSKQPHISLAPPGDRGYKTKMKDRVF